jgi:hypothetical protein
MEDNPPSSKELLLLIALEPSYRNKPGEFMSNFMDIAGQSHAF